MFKFKSAWASKTNWAQALGLVFMLCALFGIDVPEDVRKEISAVVAGVWAVVTWYLRTYHTSQPIKAKP